jgi:hypothetical protein
MSCKEELRFLKTSWGNAPVREAISRQPERKYLEPNKVEELNVFIPLLIWRVQVLVTQKT